MKKKLFLFIALLGLFRTGFTQDWMGFYNSNYAGIYGVGQQPASIADSRYKFQINLIGASAYAANNYYSLPGGRTTDREFLENLELESLLVSDRTNGRGLFASAEVQLPFSFLLTLSPKHAIAIGFKQRALANVNDLTTDFIDFAENEFEFDENEAINLNDTRLQAHTWTEIDLTYGRVILNEKEHFLKGGLTTKLLYGTASAFGFIDEIRVAEVENLNPTSLDDEVDLGNVNVTFGYPAKFDEIDDDITSDFFTGNFGLGFDLGAVYEYRPNQDRFLYEMDGEKGLVRRDRNKYKFRVGLSLLDLGGIRYQQSDNSGNLRGDAQNVSLEEFADSNADEFIESLFEFDRGGEYVMGLPTRINTNFDYHVTKGIYLNGNVQLGLKTGSSDIEKNWHPSTFSFGPRVESKKAGFALPFSIDRFSGFTSGFNFNVGPLVVGSRDFLSNFVLGKNARSASVQFALRFSMPYKKKKDRDNDFVSNRKDKCKKVPGVWEFAGCPDTDMDGVPDSEDKCPQIPGSSEFGGCPDTDGDGIQDSEDQCVDVAGLKEFNGCPDTDGDGIVDSKDNCPEVAGLKEFNGCPDTDGDGVIDKEDKCPKLAGPISQGGCPDSDQDGLTDDLDQCPNEPGEIDNEGCPYADTDQDGIRDLDDRCPNVPGVVENNGCPKIEEKEQEVLNTAFENLEFKTGSAVISNSSFPSLIELAKLLNKKPEWRLSIAGYTDNTGSRETNLKISRKRAQAVADFLVKRKISPVRLAVEGFGPDKPVASNNTRAGRQKNRRVEMKVIFE